MSLSRIVEFGVSFLMAFLLIVLVSFLTLRPTLQEVRSEARADWGGFLRAVNERNEALPGLAEAVRGFEPTYAKPAERLLEARSIAARSKDPGIIVASIDDMERQLNQIQKLAESQPGLDQYPPFATQWKKVGRISERIAFMRQSYNSSARAYNRLLTPFPQSLLTAIFGFVPLTDYPLSRTMDEPEPL
ncbi:MAG: LemA family protein [Desulfomonilaceae bacterium]